MAIVTFTEPETGIRSWFAGDILIPREKGPWILQRELDDLPESGLQVEDEDAEGVVYRVCDRQAPYPLLADDWVFVNAEGKACIWREVWPCQIPEHVLQAVRSYAENPQEAHYGLGD